MRAIEMLRSRLFIRNAHTQVIRNYGPRLYAHSESPDSPEFKISFSQDPEALSMGVLRKEKPKAIPSNPNNFEENKKFLNAMHQVMGANVHKCPTYQQVAYTEGRNAQFFSIYDFRNPPAQDRIADVEDSFGHIRVVDGNIEPNSYEPNNMYRLVSRNGYPQISDTLSDLIIKECEKN
ncbi:hypothetical protein TRVA0_015S01618 [Trichomonascus vanleenenianus]|uniref:uncharacterized protein n=1 Tax=Trichomonascus vanleenenianus TaxID=2268995 RepID=UPI003EC9AA3F